MVAIIQFELMMFWLGLSRPLGERHHDDVECEFEFPRNDATVDRKTKHKKEHSK